MSNVVEMDHFRNVNADYHYNLQLQEWKNCHAKIIANRSNPIPLRAQAVLKYLDLNMKFVHESFDALPRKEKQIVTRGFPSNSELDPEFCLHKYACHWCWANFEKYSLHDLFPYLEREQGFYPMRSILMPKEFDTYITFQIFQLRRQAGM